MRYPLASKLSQLLIVLTQNHLKWLRQEVFRSIYQTGFLDEQAKSADYRFFTMLGFTDDGGDNLAHAVGFGGAHFSILRVSELIELQFITSGLILVVPDLIDKFDTLLSDSCVGVCGSQDDWSKQTWK